MWRRRYQPRHGSGIRTDRDQVYMERHSRDDPWWLTPVMYLVILSPAWLIGGVVLLTLWLIAV